MIDQVYENIYRMEIPLPGNPLKALNSYLIKTTGKNLLIDTGMNREECREAMMQSLEELQVRPEDITYFLTHMHADHSGLVGMLANKESIVFCSEADAAVLNSDGDWEEINHIASLYGFPEEMLEAALKNHPGFKYASRKDIAYHIVREGDIISIGDFKLHCLETPGHTAGHICLYEPEHKILFSGDPILNKITPNISLLMPGVMNPLKDYLQSLEETAKLDVNLVLPGHRRVFTDCPKRIAELKEHHRERLQEIRSILEAGAMNAYNIAAKMRWDMSYPSWELFPVQQKWFATGEALSHLKYLEEEGEISSRLEGGHQLFCKL